MTSVSISQLKMNPAAAISDAQDYPLAIQNRNTTEAYLVGKSLFEKLVLYLEDVEDRKTIEKTDFSKSRDFDDIVKELGI
jgi:PHD/YefM family antitoxin component YafN of YafNO toxin-antitoxin module